MTFWECTRRFAYIKVLEKVRNVYLSQLNIVGKSRQADFNTFLADLAYTRSDIADVFKCANFYQLIMDYGVLTPLKFLFSIAATGVLYSCYNSVRTTVVYSDTSASKYVEVSDTNELLTPAVSLTDDRCIECR